MNVFFRLAAVSGAAFAATIFALLALIVSDPRAPVARFMDRHGGTLIAWEVGATLVLGFLALAVDRVRTLRERGCVPAAAPRQRESGPEGIDPQ